MEPPLTPLPESFVERLRRIVPAEALAGCLESFARERPVSFRANRLRAPIDETLAELRRAGFEPEGVAWLPEAFTVPAAERRALADAAAVAEGRVYIQGLSSMTAPLALAPRPGEAVLDLAAAPGGKTIHLAALMDNQGTLSAVEPVRDRFFKLKANLDRCGARVVRTYLTDGRLVGRKTPERFDRVLLDAPCSSEARFDCRDPRSWQYWGPRKIAESSRKQRALIRAALDALKPGGVLVYCTCAFAPEENEQVVQSLLDASGETVEIESIELALPNLQPGLTEWKGEALHPHLARAVRILPDAWMDAFFLCKLRKQESTGGDEPARGSRGQQSRRSAGRTARPRRPRLPRKGDGLY